LPRLDLDALRHEIVVRRGKGERQQDGDGHRLDLGFGQGSLARFTRG
jgi:hypothetical protein